MDIKQLIQEGLREAYAEITAIPEHHKDAHTAVLSAIEGYQASLVIDEAEIAKRGTQDALSEHKKPMAPFVYAMGNLAVELYNRHGIEGLNEFGHVFKQIVLVITAMKQLEAEEKAEDERRFRDAKPVGRPN